MTSTCVSTGSQPLPEVTQADLDLVLQQNSNSGGEEEDDLFKEIEQCDFVSREATSYQRSDSGAEQDVVNQVDVILDEELGNIVSSSTTAVLPLKHAWRPRWKDKVAAACSVCDAPVNGHKHFGAVVCHSCRAFFARATKSNANLFFKCRGEGDGGCPVNSRSWRSCKKCRFVRCLEAGMVETGVAGARFSPHDQCVLSHMFEVKLSLDDRAFMGELFKGEQALWFQAVSTFVSRDIDTFMDTLNVHYHGRSFTSKTLLTQVELERYLIHCVPDLFKKMEILSWASGRDVAMLASANLPVANVFAQAVALKTEHFQYKNEGMSRLIENVLSQVGGDADRYAAYNRAYLQVSDHERLEPARVQFKKMFPPEMFGGDAEGEAKFKSLIEELSDIPAKLHNDHGLLILLVTLIMFDTSTAGPLRDPEETSRRQEHAAGLLYRYIKSKRGVSRPGEAASLMGRCVSLASVAREAAAMQVRFIRMNCSRSKAA